MRPQLSPGCWLPPSHGQGLVPYSLHVDCTCWGNLCFAWQGEAAHVALSGAVSRTCTAPVDRLKFLMIMAHPDRQTRLTVRQVRPTWRSSVCADTCCCNQVPLVERSLVAAAVYTALAT